MPTPAELLARMLETQPPNYADEKARLGAAVGPNEGDMSAVAETDPTTWQGRLRGMGLESFVAPYEALQPAPDTTYGTMLPVARDNETGDYRIALPTMARDVATGWLDMLTGMQTGEITPAASAALQATGLPMASPSGSLASGGALRQFQAATPYGAKNAAQKASIEAGRQAWMWKTPAGKFVVNAGKKPEGAKLVGRAIGDEWVSGPGLMAKAGSKEGGAAQAAGKSLPMDEASRMARSEVTGHTVDAYHGTDKAFNSFDEALTGDVGMHFGTQEQANNAAKNAWNMQYEEGANVIPARLRMGKTLTVPDHFSTLGTSFKKRAKDFFLNTPGLNMTQEEKNSMMAVAKKADNARQRAGGDYGVGLAKPGDRNRVTYENSSKEFWDIFKKSAERNGYDSLKYSNKVEGSGDSFVVFNPNQIRSRFANFDPAKADSADLLAARTGSPELLSTLLMQQRPPRQAENDDWLRNGGA